MSATSAASIQGLGPAEIPEVTWRSCPRRTPEPDPEHREPQRRSEAGQFVQRIGCPAGCARILGAHRRHDLADNRGLLLGEPLVHPEVAGFHAISEETGAG